MEKRRQVLRLSLKDEDDGIRGLAAEALEKLETRQRLGRLAEKISSGVMLEKIRAIYAISDLKGPEVFDMVTRAAKDDSEDVRAAAIRVLGRTGDYNALSVLVEALGDSSPMVARTAVEALGNYNDPRLLRPLMQALKNKDAGVIERALEVIGKIGDKRAEEAMLYFAVKGNRRMRELAIKALGEMDA
ncbi:MAG: HEAT repeat domain-containing protein [Thermodesulfobacteriota bacterium]